MCGSPRSTAKFSDVNTFMAELKDMLDSRSKTDTGKSGKLIFVCPTVSVTGKP